MIKNIYEFLLWDNCNNNCKFCFQRENPRLFNTLQKQGILNKTIEFLESDEYIKGSHVLIVGGEIFDTPSTFGILDTFFDKIIDKMLNGDIDLLYLNTNLIYKDLDGLRNLLKKIDNNKLLDRLKFTTSYDLEGRFKDSVSEALMLCNLVIIKTEFPMLNIVTNTILTNTTCDKILDGSFNPGEFCRKYHCDINLLPYIIYDKKMSASREKVFKTLIKTDELIPGYLDRYVRNFDLPQDKLLYYFKDGKYEFCSCEHSVCGHSVNFKRYSEDGTCFVCDLKKLFD